MPYRHLMAAVDFARDTEQVCERAAELARLFQARLDLVHVVEPIIVEPAYDVLPALPAGFDAQMQARARKELVKIGDRYGIPPERCWLEVGSTKTSILRRAEQEDIDLIVLGSHGRHGVALLLGSTANAVLHGSPCDVLAVRVQ
jgi:universal stress protein A